MKLPIREATENRIGAYLDVDDNCPDVWLRETSTTNDCHDAVCIQPDDINPLLGAVILLRSPNIIIHDGVLIIRRATKDLPGLRVEVFYGDCFDFDMHDENDNLDASISLGRGDLPTLVAQLQILAGGAGRD